MRKNKFLKKFGFTSLALLMTTAGTFAFTPLSTTNAEENLTTTTGLGLDPKNDPVVYTTESGLEIKYGGAITALGGGNETGENFLGTMPSGGILPGYAYFTMGSYDNKPINWIIIGKSTSGMPTSNSTINRLEYEKLSIWQNKIAKSPTYKFWFENYYETFSPAGNLINNHGILNDVTARSFISTVQISLFSSITSHSEITSGCVLALSENICGYSTFGNNGLYEGSNLQATILSLYETGLNFSEADKRLIIPQDFLSGDNLGGKTESKGQPLFTLARGDYAYHEKFRCDTVYITSNALRNCAVTWHTRTGSSGGRSLCSGVNASGAFQSFGINESLGVRPAFVLKIT